MIKKYLSPLLFIIIVFSCFYILYYNIEQDYEKIKNIFSFEILKSSYIVLIIIFSLKVVSYRLFYFTKTFFGYSNKFLNWDQIFSVTALMNISLFASGHIMRIVHFRKNNVFLKDYTSMFLVLTLLTLLVNLIISFILFILIVNDYKYTLVLTFLFIILILPLYYSTVIYKNFSVRFKLNNKFLNKIVSVAKIIKSIFHEKNKILVIIFHTAIIYCSEFIIFYVLCDFLLSESQITTVIILFTTRFILNSIPFVSKFPGLSEILLGAYGQMIGLYFVEVALIELILRLFNYISVSLNFFFSFIFKLVKRDV